MKYLQESLETGLLNSVEGILKLSELVAQRCPTPGLLAIADGSLLAIADGTSLTFSEATQLFRISKCRKVLWPYAEHLPSKILLVYQASFLAEEQLMQVTPLSKVKDIKALREQGGGPVTLSLLVFGEQVRIYFGVEAARDKMIESFNSLAPEPITIYESWPNVEAVVLRALLWGVYGSADFESWHHPSLFGKEELCGRINTYFGSLK